MEWERLFEENRKMVRHRHAARAFESGRENAPEPLGPVDRAWLEMDDPRNPMVVSAVLELEGHVHRSALQHALAERLLRYRRFRQRVDTSRNPPLWVEDQALNVNYHVRTAKLPRGAPDAALAGAFGRYLRPRRVASASASACSATPAR